LYALNVGRQGFVHNEPCFARLQPNQHRYEAKGTRETSWMKVVIKVQAVPKCMYVLGTSRLIFDVEQHSCITASQAIEHDCDFPYYPSRQGVVTLYPASDRVIGRKEVR
jgi:hypothetical protein